MALEAAVQGRAGRERYFGLEGIEAVVERQERVLAEDDDDRRFLRLGLQISDGAALLPLG
jgi:hypothetical protein